MPLQQTLTTLPKTSSREKKQKVLPKLRTESVSEESEVSDHEEKKCDDSHMGGEVDCNFCGRSYTTRLGLKKHFSTIHNVTRRDFVNVLQKVHLWKHHSDCGGVRFLCSSCYVLVNQPHKHAIHKENLIKLKSIRDLPLEILDLLCGEKTAEPVDQLRVFSGVDFKSCVKDYKAKKLTKVQDGSEKTWTEANANSYANRLAEMLLNSNYLTDFNALEEWLVKHEKLKTAKTYQANLRLLQQFVERYLQCDYQLTKKLRNLPVAIKNMENIRKEYSRDAKCRRLAEQVVAERESCLRWAKLPSCRCWQESMQRKRLLQ